MKVLVTGATGFIGRHLVKKLADQGYSVHTLYRSENKNYGMEHPDISFFRGDVTDIDSLMKAMKDCECVFHLAAYAKAWAKQKQTYEIINYQGTVNMLEAAIKQHVKKIVVTSTAGVFGPSQNNKPVDESSKRRFPYFTEYERTKDLADKIVIAKYSGKIDVSIVCPTRVFGSGELTESNSVTKLIGLFIRGKFGILPGNGQHIGNYVFVEDVVNGLLLAMKKGRTGERYILGGENLSYSDFFSRISDLTGKRYPMIKIPVFMIIFLASMMKLLAVIFGLPPVLTPEWARKYLYDWYLSDKKARKELGYQPQSLNEGLAKTISWIRNNQ